MTCYAMSGVGRRREVTDITVLGRCTGSGRKAALLRFAGCPQSGKPGDGPPRGGPSCSPAVGFT
ncbi:hypothetical protein [Streptomyces shenzhenensis]|uniref:hypothetical protein n=1 Tax=Streptomyces shenzhenensis TaxID=943815 RepID=UPI0015F00A47|nr:hypothetical protein [Streptomyces shenzhenensis]